MYNKEKQQHYKNGYNIGDKVESTTHSSFMNYKENWTGEYRGFNKKKKKSFTFSGLTIKTTNQLGSIHSPVERISRSPKVSSQHLRSGLKTSPHSLN